MSLSDALMELELERSIALSAAIENESLLKALRQKKGEDLVKTVSFMAPGAQLPKLIQERYKVDRDLAELDLNLSPHNPNIKRLKALRSKISEQIVEEVEAILQGLQVQAEASRERIEEIDAAIRGSAYNDSLKTPCSWSRDDSLQVRIPLTPAPLPLN